MKIQFIFLSTIFLVLMACSNTKNSESVTKEKNHITFDTASISLKYLEPLYSRKTLKNYDKSLTEYINSNPNRPDSIRKVIYLLPLGNMKPENEKLIKDEITYLSIFFQLPVKIMDRITLNDLKKNAQVKTRLVPSNDYGYYSKIKGYEVDLREQIEAKSLIENYIIPNKPKDAVAILGITDHDIYSTNMNYIFGTSYLKNGTGLISTYRITDYPNETKNNIRKVVSKQITNLFSIPNVKDYICVLNYHNDINELQNGILHLSPLALEKLKYCIGFDYKKRFIELRDFWKKENYSEMEQFYDKCLKVKSE